MLMRLPQRMRLDHTVIAAALLASCVPAFAETSYAIRTDRRDPGILEFSVERSPSSAATRLVLRGAAFGVPIIPQVEQVRCNGTPLGTNGAPGIWIVPASCRELRWTVRLEEPDTADASAQRSVRAVDGSLIVLSEASSIPRLEDASAPERLLLPRPFARRAIPEAERGVIILPAHSQAPLFLAFADRPTAERVRDGLRVRYFLDDPRQLSVLTDIAQVAEGLAWLTRVAGLRMENFDFVWLGRSARATTVGGATGRDLLLVNYVRNAPPGAQNETVALVPFIEASHRIGARHCSGPIWVRESLATYLGLQALLHSRSGDSQAVRLEQQLLERGTRFEFGLVEANRRVLQGDPSSYPAFFTKGVGFWSAVDAAVREAGSSGGLMGQLPTVWCADYSSSGEPPPEFGAELGIDASAWGELSERFLNPISR